ncbi:MAG: RNA-binding domain-containing protein, partial [Spirochaetota bacterium]
MQSQRVRQLLRMEESAHLEFKSGKSGLPGSLYETICAFLNHDGGDLLVGVEDDGTVSGIDPDTAKSMAMNIASSLNNPDIIDPPYLLEPTVVEIDGLSLLHVSVPQSSRVHRHRKMVYDRGAEGDFKVASPEAIARMVNRKTGYYSESKVIPGLELHDLDEPTLQRARGFMRSRRESHPWLALDNAGLLRRAGLIQKDAEHGIEGITLAGLMLFGSEETLARFVPAYKIDCLLRKQQLERYDDRLEIRTNLMDAYDFMMGFVQKHLSDPFFLQGDVRYSLRDLIFRELIANLLVHREYS